MAHEASPSPEELEPDAPLPRGAQPEPIDEDLFDFGRIEDLAGDHLGATQPAPRPATVGTDDAPADADRSLLEVDDDDLDYDLFHFKELFTAVESEAGDDAIVESQADPRADAKPADPAPADPDEELAPTPKAVAPPPPRPAPAPPAPTPRPRLAERPIDAPALLASLHGPELERPAGLLRQRLVEVLVVAFLLANAALIFFAWQASQSFRSTLATVRDDLSSTLAEHRGSGQALAAAPAPTVPASATEAAPAAQPPTRIEGFVALEVEQVRAALAAGAFEQARRRLFGLLANADRYPIEDGDVATIEFLVADSYFQQGSARPGDAR